MIDDQKQIDVQEDLELEDDAAEKISGAISPQDDINVSNFSFGSNSSGGSSGPTGERSTRSVNI